MAMMGLIVSSHGGSIKAGGEESASIRALGLKMFMTLAVTGFIKVGMKETT